MRKLSPFQELGPKSPEQDQDYSLYHTAGLIMCAQRSKELLNSKPILRLSPS